MQIHAYKQMIYKYKLNYPICVFISVTNLIKLGLWLCAYQLMIRTYIITYNNSNNNNIVPKICTDMSTCTSIKKT